MFIFMRIIMQVICIVEKPGKGQSVLKAYESKHHFDSEYQLEMDLFKNSFTRYSWYINIHVVIEY